MRSARVYILGLLFLLCPMSAWSIDVEHTSPLGTDTVPAEYFRTWYHRSDMVYYLEALNDYTIMETPVYGQWWQADRLTFTINGLPYTANRYYIDGMRVDDRFQPGNMVWVNNMQRYNLITSTQTGQMYFSRDTLVGDYVELSGNWSGFTSGEPAPGTDAIVHLFHRTPMESADQYKHVSARRHMVGAGSADVAYTFHGKHGQAYRQHIYAHYGQRAITREDESGLITDAPYYYAPYYKAQADGTFPLHNPSSTIGYRLNCSGKKDGGSEYMYNYDEVYDLKNYTGTLYFKHTTIRDNLTTGLTWGTNTVSHGNQQFDKNILDQDGESFSPWIADGKTHEMSWAVNYRHTILPWLQLHLDTYNTLLLFRPAHEHFTNTIYLQRPIDYSIEPIISTPRTDLYRYEWNSHAFAAGLLENTLSVEAHHALSPMLDIDGRLAFTLDGMILKNKSKVSPNGEAALGIDLHPCRWFEMGVNMNYARMAYTSDYIRYLSDDYMNADVYYAGTDKLFTTTGGKYHHLKKNLPQTTYFELDIPIRLCFGQGRTCRHEIVLQNVYRKHFNVWHTRFAEDINSIGSYTTVPTHHIVKDSTMTYYFMNDGERQYTIGTTDPMPMNQLMNSPYYLSQLTRYTLTSPHVTFSLSWQSIQAMGYSGLGNGPNINTLGMLNESTANPNAYNVAVRQHKNFTPQGRFDLDKGYILRMYLGCNICKWLQAGLTFKWTDGKPFSSYAYLLKDGQVAIIPDEVKGETARFSAVFNFDLHLQGTWQVRQTCMRLRLECYNMWDFCHDLAEMSFAQDIPNAIRSSIIMDVPTGLLATFTVDLDHK